MKRAALALAAVVVALTAVSTADARMIRVGQATATGDYATATASGAADYAKAMFVRILATPRQSAEVYWSVTCANTTGGAGSKSGSYTITGPAMRRLKLPSRSNLFCSAGVTAQINGGRLRVQIFANV